MASSSASTSTAGAGASNESAPSSISTPPQTENKRKVKVLFAGPLMLDSPDEKDQHEGETPGVVSGLLQKLRSLQASKAGPFDVCFVTTSSSTVPAWWFEGEKDNVTQLPIYVMTRSSPQSPKSQRSDEDEIVLEDSNDNDDNDNDDDDGEEEKAEGSSDQAKTLDKPRHGNGVRTVTKNVYQLTGTNFVSIPILLDPTTDSSTHLKVAVVPSANGSPQQAPSPLETHLAQATSYQGCDIMLSWDWGRGLLQSNALLEQDRQRLSSSSQPPTACSRVARLAIRSAPRYHVAPSFHDFSVLAVPYLNAHHNSNPTTTRFIGLCAFPDLGNAQASSSKPNKNQKFVHAVGIQPLSSLTPEQGATAGAPPDNAVPNPYSDVAKNQETPGPSPFLDTHSLVPATANHFASSSSFRAGVQSAKGMSQEMVQRLLQEDSEAGVSSFRWNQKNRRNAKRDRDDDQQVAAAADPNNKTLFLHGLSQHDGEDSGVAVLAAFRPYGVLKVRHPPAPGAGQKRRPYAFLEFQSHDHAAQCLRELNGSIVVQGVQLTLKWGQPTNSPNASAMPLSPPPPPKRQRLTEAEAADSTSLFVYLPSHMTPSDYAPTFGWTRALSQHVLEDALHEDGHSDQNDEDGRISAETEPALRVELRTPAGGNEPRRNFAFLGFASHAAASMALVTLTGNPNGGTLLESMRSKDQAMKELLKKEGNRGKGEEEIPIVSPSEVKFVPDVQFFWAKPSDAASKVPSNKPEKGQRRRYAPDGRTECWFCLASSTCERHLILHVGESLYVTMPKGPVNPHHALIVPISHDGTDDDDDDDDEGKTDVKQSSTRKSPPPLGALANPAIDEEIKESLNNIRQFVRKHLKKELYVFERAIPSTGADGSSQQHHPHIQCIPIEAEVCRSLASRLASSSSPCRELQSADISLATLLKNDADDEDATLGYFYAEVPISSRATEQPLIKRFLYRHKASFSNKDSRPAIPVQWGREALASAMQQPHLGHWKGCVMEHEEEAKVANNFRASLTAFLDDSRD